MNAASLIVKEIVGMFIDDGSLALCVLLLIAIVVALVKLAGMPALPGGVLLLVGCLAILTENVRRAARRR